MKHRAFAKAIRSHRGADTLRTVSAKIGVSAATLSRVENGNACDIASFEKLCAWMRRDPREFLGREKET